MRTIPPSIAACATIKNIAVPVLEHLFDQVPEMAFFVKDVEGRYVAVNQSLATRHGLKDKSLAIGKRPAEICPGDFGRIPTEQDEQVLTTGRPIIDHLEMQWHVPNYPVWCLTTKLPLTDEEGRVIGIVGVSRDVRVTIDRAEVPKDFAKALSEFETQLPPNASPAWLSKRSKLSPQRLTRLMKRVFDLTPSQYIAKTRIANASRLLLETDQSIAEIAQACGFYDHSAFSRAFRLATGATPSEFRAHWQQVVTVSDIAR